MKFSTDNPSIKIFSYFFILIAIMKLILICNYEIGSGAFDAGEYARLSLVNYWTSDSSVSIWDLRRGPGVPILTLIFRLIGIPYVLGLEFLNLFLFYCIGAFTLKAFPFPLVVTAVVFAVFSPSTYTEQLLMSDQPYAIFLSLLLVVMGKSLYDAQRNIRRKIWVPVAISISAFFSVTIRDEGILIYFLLLSYCLIIFYLYKKPSYKHSAKHLCITLLLVIIPIVAVKYVNYRTYGFFGTSIRSCTNDLYEELHKISLVKTPQVAGISNSAIQLAAAVSPSFNKYFADYLISYRSWETTVDCWMCLELNNILRALHQNDFGPKEGISLLNKCVEELRENLKGVKTCRLYLYPFGNAIFDAGIWFQDYPLNLFRIVAMSYNGFEYRFFEEKMRSKLFDLILNRRSALIDDSSFPAIVSVRIWTIKNYAKITLFAVFFAFILPFFVRSQKAKGQYIAILFIFVSIYCRIGAYSLLDTFSFPHVARYVVNMNPLLVYVSIFMSFIVSNYLFSKKGV